MHARAHMYLYASCMCIFIRRAPIPYFIYYVWLGLLAGSHNQLADISCRSDEQVDCDNYSITSEAAEIVEPISKSPSLGAGLCALPTGDTEEITYQMNAAHSLPISSCKDALTETLRDEINEQTTVRCV